MNEWCPEEWWHEQGCTCSGAGAARGAAGGAVAAGSDAGAVAAAGGEATAAGAAAGAPCWTWKKYYFNTRLSLSQMLIQNIN